MALCFFPFPQLSANNSTVVMCGSLVAIPQGGFATPLTSVRFWTGAAAVNHKKNCVVRILPFTCKCRKRVIYYRLMGKGVSLL